MNNIKGKLLVFKLTVQSSYIENYEETGDELNFDTLQWWITKDETWRIKTFAKDSDIHIHQIAGRVEVETAIENTKKHYGDVIEKTFFSGV